LSTCECLRSRFINSTLRLVRSSTIVVLVLLSTLRFWITLSLVSRWRKRARTLYSYTLYIWDTDNETVHSTWNDLQRYVTHCHRQRHPSLDRSRLGHTRSHLFSDKNYWNDLENRSKSSAMVNSKGHIYNVCSRHMSILCRFRDIQCRIIYRSLFVQKERQARKQTVKATTNKH